MTDWARLAEPQSDQYDTAVIARLVKECPPPGLAAYPDKGLAGEPRIFEGRVAVGPMDYTPPSPSYDLAGPADDPRIAAAETFVRRWDPAYQQFKSLMVRFHPLTLKIDLGPWGSMSHSSEHLFGTLFATVHSSYALAEAFVHEMAHNKLRALGVFMENAHGLVLNPQSELYSSPIRKDRPRPMTAVLHAQYSFMHVTALDVVNLEAALKADDAEESKVWAILLAWNLRRMEEGYQEIQANIRTDDDGRKFVEGFFAWSDEVLGRGRELLSAYHSNLAARADSARIVSQMARSSDGGAATDWARLAEPQSDQYDTAIIARLVKECPPPGLAVYPDKGLAGEPRIFEGRVAVGPMDDTPPSPKYDLAGLADDPRIAAAESFVRRWGPAYQQFKSLMVRFHPLTLKIDLGPWGSICHSSEHLFGTLFATVHSSHALAEAFVHEMAHNKLRALGVFMENAHGLVLNPQSELYSSPIRKDRPRPMTAILHVQYSVMHVTALDVVNLEAALKADDAEESRVWAILLAWNLRRMQESHQEIQANIRTDDDGRRFVEGFFAWSDEVMGRGRELLSACHSNLAARADSARISSGASAAAR